MFKRQFAMFYYVSIDIYTTYKEKHLLRIYETLEIQKFQLDSPSDQGNRILQQELTWAGKNMDSPAIPGNRPATIVRKLLHSYARI